MGELEDKEKELENIQDEDDEDEEEEEEEEKSSPVMQEAKDINEKKEELIIREEKLQTRKEKLHAEQLISGTAVNQTDGKKEETDQEYAARLLRNELWVKKIK